MIPFECAKDVILSMSNTCPVRYWTPESIIKAADDACLSMMERIVDVDNDSAYSLTGSMRTRF